jgi:hypothetical protein
MIIIDGISGQNVQHVLAHDHMKKECFVSGSSQQSHDLNYIGLFPFPVIKN